MNKLIISLVLMLLVTACSAEDPVPTEITVTEEVQTLPGVSEPTGNEQSGEDGMQATRQVSGEVIELISDCAFDGNCAYVIETETGEQVTVIWAEGSSPICQNDPFNGGDTDIAIGDTIDALGRVLDDSTISGCGDPSYYITKTS